MLRNKKMVIGCGLAGLLAVMAGCGGKDASADCKKAKTKECGKGRYAHCKKSGDTCVPKSASSGNVPANSNGPTDAEQQTLNQPQNEESAKMFTCKQKSFKWAKECKTDTAKKIRDDVKKCGTDTTFGKDNIKGCKWLEKEQGTCKMNTRSHICPLLTGNVALTVAAGDAPFTPANTQHATRMVESGGNFKALCNANGINPLVDVCRANTTKDACINHTVNVRLTGAGGNANDAKMAIAHATGNQMQFITGVTHICDWFATDGVKHSATDTCMPDYSKVDKMRDICSGYDTKKDCDEDVNCEAVEAKIKEAKTESASDSSN